MSSKLKSRLLHNKYKTFDVQDTQPDTTTEGDPEEQPPVHTSPSSSDPSSFEVIDTLGDYDTTHAVP